MYDCYYNSSITYPQLRQLYPGCLLVKNLLVHATGRKFRQVYALTSRRDSLSFDTVQYRKENMEYLDALVLELAVRYPDFYVLDLFELEQHLLVRKCREIKFGAPQEETYTEDEVRALLSESARA